MTCWGPYLNITCCYQLYTVGGIAHICFKQWFQITVDVPRGVKRPGILWEIQKYSLSGWPYSQNWVRTKTIKKCIKIPLKMANCFWFHSMMGEWSTWQWVVWDLSQLFWSFYTPETHGSVSVVFAKYKIWNRLKQFLPVCFSARKVTTNVQKYEPVLRFLIDHKATYFLGALHYISLSTLVLEKSPKCAKIEACINSFNVPYITCCYQF